MGYSPYSHNEIFLFSSLISIVQFLYFMMLLNDHLGQIALPLVKHSPILTSTHHTSYIVTPFSYCLSIHSNPIAYYTLFVMTDSACLICSYPLFLARLSC